MEQFVEINGDMIRLGQLLKLAGAASGGADAKALVASGQVTVNGEAELKRGRQLHPGDEVRVGTEVLRIIAAHGTRQRSDVLAPAGRAPRAAGR